MSTQSSSNISCPNQIIHTIDKPTVAITRPLTDSFARFLRNWLVKKMFAHIDNSATVRTFKGIDTKCMTPNKAPKTDKGNSKPNPIPILRLFFLKIIFLSLL